MNKRFKGKTVVRKDSGIIGNWFKKKFSSLKNVKLEDPNFEKMFEVYSDDQVESRYLLTVTFMERLKELAETFVRGLTGAIKQSVGVSDNLIKPTEQGILELETIP